MTTEAKENFSKILIVFRYYVKRIKKTFSKIPTYFGMLPGLLSVLDPAPRDLLPKRSILDMLYTYIL